MKLTNENFIEVLEKHDFCITLISGEGCANCLTMLPLVKDVEARRQDVHVFYVEVDESNANINEHYEIEVVPTILLTYKGAVVSKIRGFQPQEIFDTYIDAKVKEYCR